MKDIDLIINEALKEDIPSKDISSIYLFEDQESIANFIAKEDGIISGMKVCKRTFEIVDSNVYFNVFKQDGDSVVKGDVIATVKGKTLSILAAERVGLNFLQRMSGIATMTREFVRETEGTKAEILDTRKTTPLLRILEKQAVKDGMGRNHRMSLSDMVMLKDNHLKASVSIKDAVDKVKKNIDPGIQIEVEVESVSMFKEALLTDCDIIMLDNMSLEDMRTCVFLNQGNKKIEASGNMTLNRIKDVAQTGVDYISVGALTHSYKSLDISLKF
ncbi:MAG: carboxylating nicotinate-nucleotide diphosphorylase [Firmicutes bacterium]|nr:carboxylating nicotinate-nucleotide diphosphorylase [Bacillota bacterium]